MVIFLFLAAAALLGAALFLGVYGVVVSVAFGAAAAVVLGLAMIVAELQRIREQLERKNGPKTEQLRKELL